MVHIENNDFSKDTLHALTLHWCRDQCISRLGFSLINECRARSQVNLVIVYINVVVT